MLDSHSRPCQNSGEMVTSKYISAIGFLVELSAFAVQSTAQEPDTARRGYVICAERKNPSPVQSYEHPCMKPVGQIQCGEPVEVLSRKGPFFKMRTSDASERFISVTSVSQSKKQFVAIDVPYVPWPDMADCSAFHQRQGGTHRPIIIYSAAPEYSEKAHSARISGSVGLSLTVGVDGIPHDVVVTKSLGYGLDEKAVAAVQEWKFDPAAEDGKPVPARIAVEVDFSQPK